MIFELHRIVLFRREGSTLLAQPCDCADDDLSHYDATSEPAGEVLMAAKI